MAKQLIGYQEGYGFLYRLSGASKLLFFILVSVACMTTYDTRFLIVVSLGSLVLFRLAKIKWQQVSFVMTLVVVFAVLNIIMVYLFAPHYGDKIYGSSSLLLKGIGPYDVTSQELFYLFNLILKYFCTVPLALLFLMTTNPSQFASSLNQLGLSYKIAYAVSLTLRYIPDVQEEFYTIDFLRNKIWYNSSMNYEASKQLTDVRFKRLVGVQRTTFEEMLAVLKTAYQRKHAKGGRTPKLSLEDLLMATLQYMREYRTYEQIAADFGIHESNLIRRSQWVESTLIQSGFTISKTHLSAEDTVI
ncbi:cobalt ABC transporter permease, partial [Streptococcus agalactiae BSU450]